MVSMQAPLIANDLVTTSPMPQAVAALAIALALHIPAQAQALATVAPVAVSTFSHLIAYLASALVSGEFSL